MLNAAPISVQTARVPPERWRAVSPHRQQMAAVLQFAVDDCLDSFCPLSAGYGTLAAQRRFHDARLYVLNKDRVWPFSFENLCDALDLDARKLRRRLLRAPGAATVRPTGPVTPAQILDWWRPESRRPEVHTSSARTPEGRPQ